MRPLSPVLVLVGGVGLTFLTFMRFGVGELGWVVFAPFLVALHEQGTRKRHLAVLGAVVIAFLATISKMVTAEIPWAPPVPMFAIPTALSYFATLVLASAAHRKLGVRWGIYTFASMAAVMGWVQYTFTPGSSWSALAHTQLDNLALVQLTSLTGIGGLTFLVALGSGLAAAAWTRGLRVVRGDVLILGLLWGAASIYGQVRLASPAPGPSVQVGVVVSPVTHADFYAALANLDGIRHLDDELFARSARAVDLGAKVVVWNEMATVVSVAGEAALAERGRAFARQQGVAVLMAYGVVKSLQPLRDVNKYRFYLADGTLADEYIKRHPVPGDPDEVGQAHAKVVTLDGVKFSGAICYDYGFPHIARDNALDGAGVALVPSSDWRGVDPQHGRMALMNAVAVGLPMVRPVRGATSIASDPYGRLVTTLRADSTSGGVAVAAVPGGRVPTLYARTGEVVPLLALAFAALVLVRVLRA